MPSTASITLALDAMGGDKAPESVIKGANIAAERFPNISFLLYGDEEKIKPLLNKCKRVRKKAEIHHTPDAIPNHMKPSAAMRAAGKNSSMRLAIEAVQQGKAQAVISAGNTGALMVLSRLLLGSMKGIERPAITAMFPTKIGESVMLDLGANTECDAENLVQFALMGHFFGKSLFGWDNPSIGLLNVGAENQKGKALLKEAAALLEKQYADLNYAGFIEGNDIANGKVDVIVTDGFTGNIALKTAEGTASMISDFIRQSFKHSILFKLGYIFAKPAINKLRLRLDPRQYNGAVFLGLNHISIKSHGGTDALGFAAAIEVAVDMLRQDCLGQLREYLENRADTENTAKAMQVPLLGGDTALLEQKA